MTRVFISPNPEQIKDDNGIGRVINAQYKYLPDHGIELVNSPDHADVIAGHITADGLPRIDVLMCHGLYWTGDPGSGSYVAWHHEANRRILGAAREALAITVPSPWVAECFKRDMRLVPDVIGHGIDMDEWAPANQPGQYILWNKNRVGDVCTPDAAQALAARGLPVVSTFGTPGPSMQVTGVLPHAEMREAVTGAGVYLATTKETFGIGTLEALAAGVPVLGYAWGGTADLIEHQVTGYLVEPGDVDGLAAGYAWLMEHRADVGAAARTAAEAHTWDRVMSQYAALYRRVAEQRASEKHRVSVVITNYNYGKYLQGCIDTAYVNQSYVPDEVILVDDASSDNSAWQIQNYINGSRVQHEKWQEMGLKREPKTHFKAIIHEKNQGVAAARNAGIAAATGDYIICLDADDELAIDYIDTCRSALIADRGLGIAYTGLGFLAEDGTIGPNVWRQGFDWEHQATPSNPPATTIHCAAMFRRAMWERAGGYQQVYAPGEDAEFWTRGLSVGYRAEQVTTAPLFGYRNHPDSASKTKPYRPVDTWHPWMRDQQYPMAAPAKTQPLVRSYSEPTISIIIPVGPNHLGHLPAALDSLLGQTFRHWEVICVLDWRLTEYSHGPQLRRLDQVYPFIRWDTTPSHGGGVAVGRNLGLAMARAPLVVFLDADDYLLPTALEVMLRAYVATSGKYIYTDWYGRFADGAMERHEAPEYRQAEWLYNGQHAITALIPTVDARGVGGFDEELQGWEDWDFFVKLAVSGVCGHRVPEPLLVYNYHTGQRRDESLARKPELLAALKERYAEYKEGTMPGCCGGNGDGIMAARAMLEGIAPATTAYEVAPEGVVRMEFTGARAAPVWYHGVGGGRRYYAGNNPNDKYHNVDPADVERLLSIGDFRVISQPAVQPKAAPPPPVSSAPEPPTMAALPLALPDEDAITPEQEAAMNAQVAETARRQRRSQR
jgi:glycosyltransferase involved in cell wall biosynthesis